MLEIENAVRDAAVNLMKAIGRARDVGFRVHWPVDSNGLASIAISETGKMTHTPAPVADVTTLTVHKARRKEH